MSRGNTPPGRGTRTLTRRAVLRGAALAGAASLVRPGAGLAGGARAPIGVGAAAVADAAGGVFSRWVGSLSGESAVLAAPRPFSLAGVEWAAPADALIELRARASGGSWSPWVNASVLGHGPDGRPDRPGLFGEPVWTGPARYVQLRSSAPVGGVRLHFVAPSKAPLVARAAQGFPLAQPVLDAGPGQPPIIARQAWALGRAPHAPPEYGAVKLAFVHHSVTANGYGPAEVPSIMLSIFAYHRYVRGFFDIAYNFAIDAFGRIWEARAGGIDLPVVGAHAGGYNEESTGVVVLGDFMNVVPSPAAIGALEHFLAWKLSLHGLPTLGNVTVEVAPYDYFYTPFPPGAHVSLPRIAGHRQGDSTDCPGNAFFAELPSIRPRAAALVGNVARLTLSAPAAPVSAGTTVSLSGGLTGLQGGGPLAGAPVELQLVTSGAGQTIATLTTDAAGRWSTTLTPTQNLLLRALHRPAPAAVSPVAPIGVSPALTLSLVSVSPLRVSGTVSPAKPKVTVDLYRIRPGRAGRRHPVATRRVHGAGGSFTAGLKVPGAGHYVVIARTPADARNAAGASAPLAVTIPG